MQISEYDFNLPKELIANYPKPRGQSRLMVLKKNAGHNTLEHSHIYDLPNLLQAGDLLVFNDTKVIPARIYAHKDSGGKLEIMLERMLENHRLLVQIKGGKSLKPGQILQLPQNYTATFLERNASMFIIKINSDEDLLDILQKIGEIPLPPYIERKTEKEDAKTYQTVFAKHAGAVAAPTAGLHFNNEILEQLHVKNINTGFLTLHVGAGTFQPVRCENIEEHKMHEEWINVPANLVEQIRKTKAEGGRVIAVGTTSVRSLETAAQKNAGILKPYVGFSDIFIYPGYKWQVVDGILTNFHLPKSTLLLLVSAFKSKDEIMRAYQIAIEQGYRFFSYGDAMLLI